MKSLSPEGTFYPDNELMDMKEIKPLSAALATPLNEPIGPPLTSDHTESRLVRSPVQTVNQPVETGFLTQNEPEITNLSGVVSTSKGTQNELLSPDDKFIYCNITCQGFLIFRQAYQSLLI